MLNKHAVVVTPTVTVNTAQYSSGDVVGGKITLTDALRAATLTGKLMSVTVIDQADQKAACTLLIFDGDPSAGTYTNNGAVTLHATDAAKVVARVNIAGADFETIGGKAVACLGNINKLLKGTAATLYALIVTTGTPTYVASTDLILRLGIEQD